MISKLPFVTDVWKWDPVPATFPERKFELIGRGRLVQLVGITVDRTHPTYLTATFEEAWNSPRGAAPRYSYRHDPWRDWSVNNFPIMPLTLIAQAAARCNDWEWDEAMPKLQLLHQTTNSVAAQTAITNGSTLVEAYTHLAASLDIAYWDWFQVRIDDASNFEFTVFPQVKSAGDQQHFRKKILDRLESVKSI